MNIFGILNNFFFLFVSIQAEGSRVHQLCLERKVSIVQAVKRFVRLQFDGINSMEKLFIGDLRRKYELIGDHRNDFFCEIEAIALFCRQHTSLVIDSKKNPFASSF